MLKTIYICRHGFRMNWYGSETFLPTGRPRDPVLTAHGQNQARDLAKYLASLPASEQPELIISSPYYRCLQTSQPTAELLELELVAEPGLAEWFPPLPETEDTGLHPSPARAAFMKEHVPSLSLSWKPLLYPSPNGETMDELHQRAARILQLIQERCEKLGVERVLLCSHAATLIALGRVLVDDMAKDIGAGTATLSKYVRSSPGPFEQRLNGDASFLSNGAEREWDFSHIPDNVTEPGMGVSWIDDQRPLPDTKL